MGLLDFLNNDDAKLGMGLLAAAGPSTVPMNAFQRIQMAQQGMDAGKAEKLKLALLQSQIDENASQNQLRQAQIAKGDQIQQMTSGILGGFGGAQQAPQAPQGGQSMQGGQGAVQAPTQQQIAGLRGVPLEKIAALKAAGGPDLTEVWKLANVPSSFAAGSYTQLPGQQPQYFGDPSKGLGMTNGVVGVMPGAAQAQADLARATERVKAEEAARFQEATPTLNPDGSKSVRTRLEQYGGQPAAQPGYGTEPQMKASAGGGGFRNAEAATNISAAAQREIKQVQNDLLTKQLDPASRAALTAHLADLRSQAANVSAEAAPAPAGNVVELSPAQIAQNKANETRLVNTASADVVRDTARTADAKRFGQVQATADRAIELLKQGPTASGAGAAMDSTANFFGKSTKGADIASQLDTLSGWMTANVPRMEGPQSDKDVAQYRIMAAAVGDRTKPISQRLAAAEELKSLQDKYADLNGIAKTGGASGDWSDKESKPKVIDSLPKSAPVGQRIRDTQTGKILKFDGLKWKPE